LLREYHIRAAGDGLGKVYRHRGICSFDFGGSFALLIAILGYIQLVVVLTSFIVVSRKMNRYEKGFGHLRGGRTLTFENSKLQAIKIKSTQEIGIRGKNGSNDINTSARG